MTRIAIIARNPIFSPNMTGNDAAILEGIAAELESHGAEVIYIDEESEIPDNVTAVCTMSRTTSTISRLKDAEKRGIQVLNPTAGVENCSRRRFMEILHWNAIPQPPFKIVDSSAELSAEYFPCWIKKAEGWSCHCNDVSFAGTKDEATAAIEEMAQRGANGYIQMLHCPGDIIKFYGIGEQLFHHSYPTGTKFGKEQINGSPKHYGFNASRLKEIAQKAAKAVGIEIYGGDAIVTPQGEIFIIDINDFPSFTAIRDLAAKEIAKLIMNKTSHTYER